MYPKVIININKLNENIRITKELCNKNNIKLNLVLKVLGGNTNIINKIDFSLVDSVSDSRIDNLKKIENINVEKWLIRLPSVCEISDVIKYSDVSFNSCIETIRLLNEEAVKQNKIHKVVLMYELGDLREGTTFDKLNEIIKESKSLSNINIYGIASNLACYAGCEPTIENTNEFYSVKERLERENNIKFSVYSCANSTSYKLLLNGNLKDKCNYVRFGESIFLGNIPGYDEKIDNYNCDVFTLKALISEIEYKNTCPKGRVLKNSFGETISFKDEGIRLKALINIGKQDVNENIMPLDNNIKVLHGSSDYMVIDINDSINDYKVGDEVSFYMDYASLLKCMTSYYVRKEII